MNPRHLLYVGLISILIPVFLAGCSVRVVPLNEPFDEAETVYDEGPAYYEGYYRSEYGAPRSAFSSDAWHMSQYYRYADERHYGGYAPDYSYLPPDRMNIDPNPNDKYQAGERPLRRAPTQYAAQARNDRLSEGRQDSASSQRTGDRARRTSPTTSVDRRREKEGDVRQRLTQRRERQNEPVADEDREERRRKLRQRTRK